MLWDVFISHASEDKEEVARPLAKALQAEGFRVWLDENELSLGDSLQRKIDEGLAESRFGLVIISESFLAKPWPQNELSALWGREIGRQKVLLPVWHKLTRDEVARISPLLADRIAVRTDAGLETVVAAVIRALGGSRRPTASQLEGRYSPSFMFPDQLLEGAKSAITQLHSPDTWKELHSKRDMTLDEVWMGTDSPKCVEIFYGLYAPLVLYRQRSYALRRSRASFDTEARLRYGMLEAAFYSLTHEDQLAACGKAIEYTPRRRGWRSLRVSNPSRYWWQGLSEERFDLAKPFFLASVGSKSDLDLVPLSEFRRIYAAAYVSSGSSQDLGLLANALYDFTPSVRPVFWRLLAVWHCLYSTYAGILRSEITDLSSFDRWLSSEHVDYLEPSPLAIESLFEPISNTREAVGQFLERFVRPVVQTLLASPD